MTVFIVIGKLKKLPCFFKAEIFVAKEGVTGGYRKLQGVTGGYMGLQ